MQKTSLLILIIVSTFISPVRAASPSPSPTPPLSEVTENLKKRLQESLDTKETSPLSSARAYIGIVKDIIKDTIIIEDKDGKRDIKLGDDTSIIRSPGNAVIKADNIRIDDSIIAIGYPTGNDTLDGRRLVVSTTPLESPQKTSGFGTIKKIDKAVLTLLVSDQDKILTLTGKTIYKSTAGSIEPSDLAVGDTLVYTATLDSEKTTTATILMRVLSASISE
ncbi:MAG: hypothetical protein ABII21_04590 [bacterium]